jgi:hypothetical protein
MTNERHGLEMIFDRLAFAIYKNVKVNEHALPKYYPGRVFEEVDLVEIEYQIIAENYVQVYEDLALLNNYLISKLGKMCYGQSYLKQEGLDKLRYLEFVAERNTLRAETTGIKQVNVYRDVDGKYIINVDDGSKL